MSAPEETMMSSERIPSLDLLGDRLEEAVARAIAPTTVAGSRSGSSSRSRSGRPRSRAIWLLTPALAAAVMVIVLTVVVGGPATPPAQASILAAAQKTVDAATGQFSLRVDLGRVDAAFDTTVVTLDGTYDVRSGRVAADVDLRSLVGGLGDGDHRATIVVEGSNAYVSSPTFEAAFGTSWARFDLERLLGTSPNSAEWALAPTDPAAFLQLLTGLEGQVSEDGTAEIDGQVVTRYRGEISIAKALEHLDGDERAHVEAELARLGAAPAELLAMPPVPFVVWIDGDGLVRRIESTLTVSGAVEGQRATFTVDYREVGAPVAIPEPTSDAVDATALVERLVPRLDSGS